MGVIAEMLATAVGFISSTLQLLILGSVIVNLVGADPYNPIVRMIQQTTEPMYRPIRKYTRHLPGPLDWSPMVVILIIITLQAGIMRFLRDFAH